MATSTGLGRGRLPFRPPTSALLGNRDLPDIISKTSNGASSGLLRTVSGVPLVPINLSDPLSDEFEPGRERVDPANSRQNTPHHPITKDGEASDSNGGAESTPKRLDEFEINHAGGLISISHKPTAAINECTKAKSPPSIGPSRVHYTVLSIDKLRHSSVIWARSLLQFAVLEAPTPICLASLHQQIEDLRITSPRPGLAFDIAECLLAHATCAEFYSILIFDVLASKHKLNEMMTMLCTKTRALRKIWIRIHHLVAKIRCKTQVAAITSQSTLFPGGLAGFGDDQEEEAPGTIEHQTKNLRPKLQSDGTFDTSIMDVSMGSENGAYGNGSSQYLPSSPPAHLTRFQQSIHSSPLEDGTIICGSIRARPSIIINAFSTAPYSNDKRDMTTGNSECSVEEEDFATPKQKASWSDSQHNDGESLINYQNKDSDAAIKGAGSLNAASLAALGAKEIFAEHPTQMDESVLPSVKAGPPMAPKIHAQNLRPTRPTTRSSTSSGTKPSSTTANAVTKKTLAPVRASQRIVEADARRSINETSLSAAYLSSKKENIPPPNPKIPTSHAKSFSKASSAKTQLPTPRTKRPATSQTIAGSQQVAKKVATTPKTTATAKTTTAPLAGVTARSGTSSKTSGTTRTNSSNPTIKTKVDLSKKAVVQQVAASMSNLIVLPARRLPMMIYGTRLQLQLQEGFQD